MIRMDIQTIVVGGGPVTSLIVLKTRFPYKGEAEVQLPIRIGPVEAMAISMGIDDATRVRPITHDLLASTIESLGATLDSVNIVDVHGPTFFAELEITRPNGTKAHIDARPSDAIALAVRTNAPIFAEESVLDAATLPDFKNVENDEKKHQIEEFHEFVETLSPDDFS